jgi:hypothetical protein
MIIEFFKKLFKREPDIIPEEHRKEFKNNEVNFDEETGTIYIDATLPPFYKEYWFPEETDEEE